MRRYAILVIGLLSTWVGMSSAMANPVSERVNKGTIGILASSFAATDLHFVADMALAFNKGYDLRILPIIGEGSVRSVEDLLYLRGIDIAIVQSDVLNIYQQFDSIDDIGNRISYIAKLHEEEVHVLARSEIRSIDDLIGRKVSFGSEESGTFLTASLIFEELGINVDVHAHKPSVALERLKEGKLDAMVVVDGAPLTLFEGYDPRGSLHLLPIPASRITGAYAPTVLTTEHYPNLIEGSALETVSTSAVLAAFNFPRNAPRRARIGKFVDQLFGQFDSLKLPPHHEKWLEIDLRDEVPNWSRHPAVDKWLRPASRRKS